MENYINTNNKYTEDMAYLETELVFVINLYYILNKLLKFLLCMKCWFIFVVNVSFCVRYKTYFYKIIGATMLSSFAYQVYLHWNHMFLRACQTAFGFSNVFTLSKNTIKNNLRKDWVFYVFLNRFLNTKAI